MSTGSITDNRTNSQAPLTHVVKMTSQQFYARIARNNQVRLEHRPGEILVFRGEERVARWLPYPQVLHYIPTAQTPQRALEDTPTTWPPACPDCGGPMVVKFGGDPREPFWSCKKWDGPFPRPCTGRMPFTLHLDELAEYNGYDPRHWRELMCRSLARLIADEEGF